MTPTLYFLRSSESKIVKDMTQYAHPDSDNLEIYHNFYGLTTKDLGLYALINNKITGAIWTRKLNNDEIPILSLAVLPEFRGQGLATAMMEQFLIELSAVSELISVNTYNNDTSINFYTKFGFSHHSEENIMTKTLEKQEIVRPTDGYDPRKWMD